MNNCVTCYTPPNCAGVEDTYQKHPWLIWMFAGPPSTLAGQWIAPHPPHPLLLSSMGTASSAAEKTHCDLPLLRGRGPPALLIHAPRCTLPGNAHTCRQSTQSSPVNNQAIAANIGYKFQYLSGVDSTDSQAFGCHGEGSTVTFTRAGSGTAEIAPKLQAYCGALCPFAAIL